MLCVGIELVRGTLYAGIELVGGMLGVGIELVGGMLCVGIELVGDMLYAGIELVGGMLCVGVVVGLAGRLKRLSGETLAARVGPSTSSKGSVFMGLVGISLTFIGEYEGEADKKNRYCSRTRSAVANLLLFRQL
jgi:hypothetical protein